MKTVKEKKTGFIKGFFQDSPVKWWDLVILFLIMAFCFVSFEMRDLFHTSGCSYGFLDGHFLDFYDYLAKEGVAEDLTIGLHASYMPTVYWIFAIWNIPMKLFGFVPKASADLGFIPIMWAKILPCVVFLLSGLFIFRIARELKIEENKAKLCMYAYIANPVVLFGQFILGQYESFLVLCIVLGIYFWLKKKDLLFILMFAVGITFKYTALIFFLPLLLLREKKIPKILLSCGLSFIPYILEYLLYSGSPMFKSYVFGVGSGGDNPTGYVTNASFFTGFTFGGNLNFVIYLAFLAFAFVVAYAYFKKVDEEDEGRYMVYIGCLSAAALFCFSKWHPHWLMVCVPYWTLSAFLHRETKTLIAVDLIFGVLLMLFCAVQFDGITDEIMLSKGIFKFILPGRQISVFTDMSEYVDKIDMSIELTLITAIMGVYALFGHPKYMTGTSSEGNRFVPLWIRLRFLVCAAVFILPALLCVKNSLKTPSLVYEEDRRGIFINMENTGKVSQPFVSQGNTVSKLIFPVSRGEEYDTPVMSVTLKDEKDTVLYTEDVNIGNYYEGQLVRIKPSGVSVVPGKTYYVEFETVSAKKSSTFCLLAFDKGDYPVAEAKGREQKYHMNLRIYQ